MGWSALTFRPLPGLRPGSLPAFHLVAIFLMTLTQAKVLLTRLLRAWSSVIGRVGNQERPTLPLAKDKDAEKQ